MITIQTNSIAQTDYELTAFLTSLSSHASDKENYELIMSVNPDFADKINFVAIPNADSRVTIILPDNCLVLQKDWDKYILYMLDNDKPINDIFLKRRLGLVGRPDNGVFPGLAVVYPVNTY